MPASPNSLRLPPIERSSLWLVTGAAGFIGSHLVEALLRLGQSVTGMDDFSAGKPANLEAVRASVGERAFGRFRLVPGDVTNPGDCLRAVVGADHVLHHAALTSVPGSLADPLGCNAVNVTGCLNMLEAARREGVSSFVYASSSAVYGDDPRQPKTETMGGVPLSPYALSKTVNELHAQAYARLYGLRTVGLRYFNVFGPRQDPHGAYAAVIPRWFESLARGRAPVVFGDGLATRDFCYVSDVVRANILAASSDNPSLCGQALNIGGAKAVTLLELLAAVGQAARPFLASAAKANPTFGPPRAGDIRHSQADIGKARELIGYRPVVSLAEGLALAAPWYLAGVSAQDGSAPSGGRNTVGEPAMALADPSDGKRRITTEGTTFA